MKDKDERNLVLIVDDEPDMLSMLKLVIGKKCNCDVITTASALEALTLVNQHSPHVVISDIKMPDLDGLELLKKIRERDTTISVVIMTGYGTISMAVEALKDGAYDFLQKPFDKDHILRIIKNGLERTLLLRANEQLQKKLSNLAVADGFVGQSMPLKKTMDLLSRIADTDATVLIRGESGTGKEIAARTLHNLSRRKHKKMITVNCPALPENVLESELFGYSKGAFTGAEHDKKGLFLEAQNSTILLDEIADIPVSLQTKLLRVLQEKEIQPLGQNRTIKVNARVVASTNQDLEARIRTGEFREDLFYRLNVLTVTMPNLETIKEDIPLLAHHFFELFKKQYSKAGLQVPQDILEHLYHRPWPGNVRELQNTIKRLVLLAENNTVKMRDLAPLQQEKPVDNIENVQDTIAPPEKSAFSSLFSLPYNTAKAELIQSFSQQYIDRLLTEHQGNVTRAAASCGLERQALQRLMRRYHIFSADYKTKRPSA